MRTYRNRIFQLLAALATYAAAFAADPYAGYIYPSGMQVGTTNRFIIGGQGMWKLKGVHFGNAGLHVLNIEMVPNFQPPQSMQRRHLKKWLDGIADGNRIEPPLPNDPHISEWRTNAWWSTLGSLDSGKLAIVERNLYTPRNALQETPSLRQMALITVAADANAQTGRCEFTIWSDNGMSAPRPFEVTSLPHVEEPVYVPPHRKQPQPLFVDVSTDGMVLDGQIFPGSTDVFSLRLAAHRRYAFRVTARELQPYIGDAVPGFFNPIIVLKDDQNQIVASADDAERFLPDPTLSFTPQSAGNYRLEIHDVLYRGRADFVYSIAVTDEPHHQIPEADGTVEKPGAVSSRTFEIGNDLGPRVLEVTARRRGSPLDAVLTLRKGNGEMLAQWDDSTNTLFVGTIPQGEYDPIGIYDFKEPGKYIAEITDRTGHGGKDYVWWLDIRRPAPGFEVKSTRSTLTLRRNRPIEIGFRILRKDGFTGDVSIEFPPCIRSQCPVATAGVDSVSAKLFYAGKGYPDAKIHPIRIFARAEIDGRTVRVPVSPCDEYEQAFAWKHLVPARTFLMRCIVPAGKRR